MVWIVAVLFNKTSIGFPHIGVRIQKVKKVLFDIKPPAFEHWTFHSEAEAVTSALLMFDYVATKFNTYPLSHFLDDFSYRSYHKWYENDLKID